jgi:hypothetical protein
MPAVYQLVLTGPRKAFESADAYSADKMNSTNRSRYRILLAILALTAVSVALVLIEALTLAYQPAWGGALTIGLTVAVYLASFVASPRAMRLAFWCAAGAGIAASLFFINGALNSPEIGQPALWWGIAVALSTFLALLAVRWLASSIRVQLKGVENSARR